MASCVSDSNSLCCTGKGSSHYLQRVFKTVSVILSNSLCCTVKRVQSIFAGDV